MPEITFLGTGTSNGIPVIGCDCQVCRSTDPRDRRTRTSALVRYKGHAVLIDTATELRAQALANDVRWVDAVLMTHAHADHTGGFDDLRRFNELQGAHIPVYADPGTAAMLRERYAYKSSRFRYCTGDCRSPAFALVIWLTSPMPRRYPTRRSSCSVIWTCWC
jgi:phosphoribosyl 1,2-cyclic phosphate phosphodiesterase